MSSFPKNGNQPKIQTIGGPQLLPFLPLPPFSKKNKFQGSI
jgi:hypothetical protein